MALIVFRQRNLYFTLILIFVLASSVVLVKEAMRPAASSGAVVNAVAPDSFMKSIQYTEFNQTGFVSSQMTASSLTHYTQDDTALIQNPRLVYFTEQGYRWVITGDNAKSFHSLNKIDISDNVKIEKINSNNNQVEMTITTSHASAFPKKKYAFTDAPVTITQLDSVVNSVGMSADLNTGQVKLFSNAEGVYQNEKK